MTKNVVYKLNTDPGNTAQTVGDIQKEYKKLNKEIQDTVQGSEEYYAIVARMGDLKANIMDLREEIKALDPGEKLAAVGKLAQGAVGAYTTLTSAVSVFAGSNEELQEQLLKVNAAIGLLQGVQSVMSTFDEGKRIISALTVSSKANAAAMKETAKATEGASVATKGFGTAFKAIGIGLIVSAIAYLITNWEKLRDKAAEFLPFLKDTGEAFDEIKVIAYGVGNALLQFVLAPINAIVKAVQGDFEGAMEAFKKGADFVNNYQAGAAKERQDQIDEANRKALEASIAAVDNEVAVLQARGKKTYEIERENLRRRLELHRDNLEDYNKVLQDIRLLDARHEKEQEDERKKANEKYLAEMKKRNEEIRKAEEERLQILIEANSKVLTLQQQQQLDALNEVIKNGEQTTQVESDQYSKRFGAYNEFAPKILEASQKTADTSIEQQQNASNELTRIRQNELDQEIQIQLIRADNILGLAGNLTNSLATLLGESAEESKGVQIALGTIDSIRGAISAYMGMIQVFPGPWGIAAGAAAAALTFAAGMVNVAKIKSVNPKGGGGATSVSYQAPAVPTTANVTQLDQTSVDQITQRTNPGPQRAFVVESDISDSQERVNGYTEASQF